MVFHLGDYATLKYAINPEGGERRYTDRVLPDVFNRETMTLADYRLRYSLSQERRGPPAGLNAAQPLRGHLGRPRDRE